MLILIVLCVIHYTQAYNAFISPKDLGSISKSKLITGLVHDRKPSLLRKVFNFNDESFVDEIVKKLSDKSIEYDARTTDTGEIEQFECKLSEFLDIVGTESDHEENIYLLNEDIVNEDDFVSSKVILPEKIFGKNQFDEFPKSVRPKIALVIGGEGARSFLHRDPFEWIGWNHLLEGRKLWIFLRPEVHELEEGLLARRHEIDAWNMDNYPIGAGYISEVDLFLDKIALNVGQVCAALRSTTSTLPTSKPRIDMEMFPAFAQAIIQNFQILSKSGDNDYTINRYESLPLFATGESDLDEICEDDIDETSDIWYDGFYIAIQEPGETVFIPPGTWHQVYHLEPSIALAGQHMNDDNRDLVIDHILDYCSMQASDVSLREDIDEDDIVEDYSQIDSTSKLFKIALKRRFGNEMGLKKWRELFI